METVSTKTLMIAVVARFRQLIYTGQLVLTYALLN
jgi:hypothetical protein